MITAPEMSLIFEDVRQETKLNNIYCDRLRETINASISLGWTEEDMHER